MISDPKHLALGASAANAHFMKSTSRSTVLALYRALLREAHKLSDPLVQFTFSNYIRDKFRKNVRISDESLRYRKIKTAKIKLRYLHAANAGDKVAVARALRFTYGVSGPLRHQNLTTYKRIGGPPNPNEPRPPPFPAALRALLASPLARKKASMKVQPDEPAALSLALDKRGWLGKLPERRERNLWWNWWREEPTKTLVPAEIEVIDEAMNSTVIPSLKSTDELGGPGAGNNVAHGSDSRTLSASLHLRQLGLPVARTQETGLIRRAEVYARNRIVPNPPRRSVERITGSGERNHQEPETTPLAIPPQSRFVRRRYRDLLSKMPLLTFKPAPSLHTPTTHAPGTTNEYQQASPSPLPTTLGKFNVTISPIATTQGPRNRVTYSLMSQEDREWIERARHIKNPTTPGNGQTSIHSKNT